MSLAIVLASCNGMQQQSVHRIITKKVKFSSCTRSHCRPFMFLSFYLRAWILILKMRFLYFHLFYVHFLFGTLVTFWEYWMNTHWLSLKTLRGHSVDTKQTLIWHSGNTQQTLSRRSADTQLTLSWHSVYTQWTLSWHSANTQETLRGHSAYTQRTLSRHSAETQQTLRRYL